MLEIIREMVSDKLLWLAFVVLPDTAKRKNYLGLAIKLYLEQTIEDEKQQHIKGE